MTLSTNRPEQYFTFDFSHVMFQSCKYSIVDVFPMKCVSFFLVFTIANGSCTIFIHWFTREKKNCNRKIGCVKTISIERKKQNNQWQFMCMKIICKCRWERKSQFHFLLHLNRKKKQQKQNKNVASCNFSSFCSHLKCRRTSTTLPSSLLCL